MLWDVFNAPDKFIVIDCCKQSQNQKPLLKFVYFFFRLMEELCQSQSMTDVTVACGDVSLEAHSIILSASSPLLR